MFTRAANTIRRHASRPLGRTMLLSAAALIVVVAGFRIVTPFLISEAAVRERMEEAVARWTGQRATIGGVSTIRFWPHPEVTLSDITIHREASGSDAAGKDQLLATVGQLSASFDLMEALIGRPVFEDFHLSGLHAYLTSGPDGRLHWAGGGLMAQAIGSVRGNSGGQVLDEALDAPLGEIEIANGIIDITRDSDGHVTRFDAVNGTLDWQSLSEPAEIDATAVLRGRRINLDIRSSQPLLLLDGRSGQLQASASTDIGSARFSGVASLTARGFFSGSVEGQASDMPAMMRWFGVDPALADGLNSASVSGEVVADREELRLERLSLGLNNENATGLLELDTPLAGPPRLTSTLAFDHIDFLRLLAALKPAISRNADALPTLITGLEMDLRLSSQAASLGAVQMQDLALALVSIGPQFRLDILDSSLQPGRLTGRISTVRDGDTGAVSFRMALRGADFAALAQRLQISGPIPAAQGNLDLALDLPQPITPQSWAAANGTFSFSTGAGQIAGIDINAIRQMAQQKPYFSLAETASAALEFDAIKAAATVREGIADLGELEISGRNETISLAGAVPLADRSLALSATISPKDGSLPSTFFIGGAWPAPILWPMETPAPKPGE